MACVRNESLKENSHFCQLPREYPGSADIQFSPKQLEITQRVSNLNSDSVDRRGSRFMIVLQ